MSHAPRRQHEARGAVGALAGGVSEKALERSDGLRIGPTSGRRRATVASSMCSCETPAVFAASIAAPLPDIAVHVVESGGVKIKDMLVKLDLTGSVFLTCCACKSGLDGASHTHSRAK